jgi:hypothetical protein
MNRTTSLSSRFRMAMSSRLLRELATVNAMRVPPGACCSSHVRFSGSAAWPAFRA